MTTSRGTGVVFLGAFIVLSQPLCAHGQAVVSTSNASSSTAVSNSGNGNSPVPDVSKVDFRDADSILRLAIPKTMRNHRDATAFTYGISYRNRNFTTDGKLLTDYSAKYDVIFVGGLPYRRQIEENSRRLAGLEAAEEQKRLDATFAERSRMTLEQKRDYLKRPWNVDVPLPLLTELFTNRVAGEAVVDGRPAVIVESIPRSNIHAADKEKSRALNKRVKLWIDRDDLIVSRIEATLVKDDASMRKGTVAKIDFLRKDGVWLPVESDVRFEATTGTEIVRGETQEVNGDFHRFHVDVRLLEPGTPGTDSIRQAQ